MKRGSTAWTVEKNSGMKREAQYRTWRREEQGRNRAYLYVTSSTYLEGCPDTMKKSNSKEGQEVSSVRGGAVLQDETEGKGIIFCSFPMCNI